MKRLNLLTIILALGLMFTADYAIANNIRVSNIQLYTSSSQPAGTVDIKFDVAWDNSNSNEASGPTDANGAHYFDRAWIFVKFWDSTVMNDVAQPWGHAILTTGGSLSTYSQTTHTGITADGIGAFAKPGMGQTVRWNYTGTLIPGTSSYVAASDTVKVRVMAIEMARVPQGQFYIGDGNGTLMSTYAFYQTANTAVLINNTLKNNIKCDAAIGDDSQLTTTGIGIKGDGGLDTNNDGTIDNPNFPTGYNAFYIMKYGISQGQYRDFLNMLSRIQQNKRTVSQAANMYAMTGAATVTFRDTIRCPSSIPSGAITFGCDLNQNGVFNESNDGEWIQCNYLGWTDQAAYAAWAGLRPATETEFEKTCRGGGVVPVPNECVWGTTSGTLLDSYVNGGTARETASPSSACWGGNYAGPGRCGIFATSSSTRAQAGAAYYGVLDVGSYHCKAYVTLGNATGRSFAGSHGNGMLTTTSGYEGNAMNIDWPGIDAVQARGVTSVTGIGIKGGGWGNVTGNWTSERSFAARTDYSVRNSGSGGRCARTSP